MASIRKKETSWEVRYKIKNESGIWKDRSKSFPTRKLAKDFQRDIETKTNFSEDNKRNKKIKTSTFDNFLDFYIEKYGKETWKLINYDNNVSIINYYIRPYFKEYLLTEINSILLTSYFSDLLKINMKGRYGTHEKRKVTLSRREEIRKRMKSILYFAVDQEYIEKNPMAKLKQNKKIARNIKRNLKNEKKDINPWDANTTINAIYACEEHILKLAMLLSFTCSLRIGEVTGLTWDKVVINGKENAIIVEQQLQRINKDKINDPLFKEDIIEVFNNKNFDKNKTVTALVSTKTDDSDRTLLIHSELTKLLLKEKQYQITQKKLLGKEYIDHNLVIAQNNGNEVSRKLLSKKFAKLIAELELVPNTFHSLRHSFATTVLEETNFDYKTLQKLLGHSKCTETLETYAHTSLKKQLEIMDIWDKMFIDNSNRIDENTDKEIS